jgi:acyl-CoA synthetase (AMP-forming)/AMP-acid ligase II
MSETMMNFCNPVEGKRIPRSVGLPLPGVQVRFVNENFEDQPLNVEGEILLKGENVFQGYWNAPEVNEKSFRDGWFLTGDIGKMDEEGCVYIVGRKKDIIKSGGLLIYPKEVEEVIISIPQVKECAVIGVPDEKYGESVKACVVLCAGSVCAEEIINYCKSRMASFKKPRHVEFLDSLPRNMMGKVLKDELRKMHSNNQSHHQV